VSYINGEAPQTIYAELEVALEFMPLEFVLGNISFIAIK
jgi:hypothetical protein